MNHDYRRRDEIIFGGYDPKEYCGGCRRGIISYDVLKQLMDEHFIDKTECQNDSPTAQDFLDYTEFFRDDTTFEIYAISPERDDYRVTVEGVQVDIDDTEHDKITSCVEVFHWADEFSFDHYDGKYHLRAWWD